MYPQPTHMARHFQSRRVEMRPSLAQLARIVGYTNVCKGHRKIDLFERTGQCHPILFAKLMAALNVQRKDPEPPSLRRLQGLACRSRQPSDTVPASESDPWLPRSARGLDDRRGN